MPALVAGRFLVRRPYFSGQGPENRFQHMDNDACSIRTDPVGTTVTPFSASKSSPALLPPAWTLTCVITNAVRAGVLQALTSFKGGASQIKSGFGREGGAKEA